MQRREFITLLAGATAAWPLAARAQQRENMRSVGVLTPFAAHDTEGQNRVTAFAQALQQLGWSVGQNVRLLYRWGDGTSATMQKYAAELVALAPDVILADSSAAVAPLLQATRTFQSCSRLSPIRSAPAMWKRWRDRAATLPALLLLNMASPASGWSFSRRSHRA